MWLRESLPYDMLDHDTNLPMARVVTYGYNTSMIGSNSMQTWEDLATSLHTTLLSFASVKRPLIFIAHSLGGLILKQVRTSLHRHWILN